MRSFGFPCLGLIVCVGRYYAYVMLVVVRVELLLLCLCLRYFALPHWISHCIIGFVCCFVAVAFSLIAFRAFLCYLFCCVVLCCFCVVVCCYCVFFGLVLLRLLGFIARVSLFCFLALFLHRVLCVVHVCCHLCRVFYLFVMYVVVLLVGPPVLL